jgi:hypothetical protein
MRYALVFLFVLGCRGPKSADAAPPSKESIVQALERYEALSAEREKETASKVDSLAETVGNSTAELEAVKEELRGVKAGMESLEDKVEGLQKLLTVSDQPASVVPQIGESPGLVIEIAEPWREEVTLHGKPLDVAATIKQHYVRRWTHPGTIDSHLAEHGVAGFQGLDDETKERLHSALHEMGQAPAKAVTKSRTVYRAPVAVPSQRCPNGQCPSVRQYGYQQSRSRLFGWRR